MLRNDGIAGLGRGRIASEAQGGTQGGGTSGGQKFATRQHRAPEAWLAAVETSGHATRGREALSAEMRLAELVMMGLRLNEGPAGLVRLDALLARLL